MSVQLPIPIHHQSQEAFGHVAYEVVGHAFRVHTSLGKRFHESVYRSTMRKVVGDRAIEELPITITHQDFSKTLLVDFLVDQGCPFELKVATQLTDQHTQQLIQYLMLLGLSHGKLINFGRDEVEHRFVNCLETLEQRQQFEIERIDWTEDSLPTEFERVLINLLRDWGTGLSRSLYEEACVHLFGGERCLQFVPTYWSDEPTGRQTAKLLDEKNAFEITCKRRDLSEYKSHLQRFVNHTNLDSVLWANVTSGCVRLQRVWSESWAKKLTGKKMKNE